uniref:X-prolyl aminopeptidase 2 n=1 Tax=Laticauda laticaudata TaxID=8630 RepID=A0A8C5S242_LATLA
MLVIYAAITVQRWDSNFFTNVYVGLAWWVWQGKETAKSPFPPPRVIGRKVEARGHVPLYLPPTAIVTSERLKALREHMRTHNLSAYIVPNTDAHLVTLLIFSISSLGTGVITLQKAVLFTDSRYWIQAERQMDCNWELQKSTWVTSIGQWLFNEVPAGETIGLDPFLFSVDTWYSYHQILEGASRILNMSEVNLVDLVWGSERLPPPTNTIYCLTDDFIGSTWQEKVAHARSQMEQHNKEPTAILLSGLEETAWLFNLRGDDIPYTPVFYAYTLLTKTDISLFVNRSRLSTEALQILTAGCPGSLCVKVEDYDQIGDSLRKYAHQDGVIIWIGTEYTTLGLYKEIPQENLLEDDFSPVMLSKAVKNSKEQKMMEAAHIRDAVALIQYLVWLEKNVPKNSVDEVSGAHYLDTLRREELYCQGPSFQTISASGLNAALAHYSPSNFTSQKLSPNEMYLLDSGGQYFDGTTDITRTIHWGEPTAFQKEAYTRVLMGNIDLSKLVFPPRTSATWRTLPFRDLLRIINNSTGSNLGNLLVQQPTQGKSPQTISEK